MPTPTPTPTPTNPLFADSPAEQFRGNWRFASPAASPDLQPTGSSLAPAKRKRQLPWHYILLGLIILLGGAMRFYRLGQPALWSDEAATYFRVSGTYPQLLEQLRLTRFMPLHYQLLWWIGQYLPLDTWALRLVPAITGTMIIPVMYLLGRLLAGKRVGLATALFTACSAWMLIYSRDAKMYMPVMFFVACSMASFVCWMRSRSILSWLCLVLSGAAAGGFHAPALIPIALLPIFYLLNRKVHWRSGLALLAGIFLIASVPAVHYLHFPRIIDEFSNDRRWNQAGIEWVSRRNEGHTSAELVADTASSFSFGWQFIQEKGPFRDPPKDLHDAAAGTLLVLGLLLMIGMLPWPARWRGDANPDATIHPAGRIPQPTIGATMRPAFSTPVMGQSQPQAPMFATGDSPPNRTHKITSWTSTFWVIAWILWPALACYYLSVPDRPDLFQPTQWVSSASSTQLADFPLVVSMLYWLRDLSTTVLHSGLLPWLLKVLPAAMLIAAILMLHRSIARWITLLMALALVAAAIASARTAEWTDATAALDHLLAMLARPWVMPAACAILLALLWHAGGQTLKQRLLAAGKALLVTGGLFIGCVGITLAIKSPLPGSVWMPRYLSALWPAFAVGFCWLLMRLPTWPLRTLALLILLAANLAQGGGRILADNEPPLDRVSADIIAAQPNNAHLLVYTPPFNAMQGPPGTGMIMGEVGKYYLFHYGKKDVPPEEFRYTDVNRFFRIRMNSDPRSITSELRQRPDVDHIVLWQRQEIGATPRDPEVLANALGTAWQLQSRQVYHVRCFWQWSPLYDYVRTEYARTPADK